MVMVKSLLSLTMPAHPWRVYWAGVLLACGLPFAGGGPANAAAAPQPLKMLAASPHSEHTKPGTAVAAAGPRHGHIPQSIPRIPKYHSTPGVFSSPFGGPAPEGGIHNHHGPICRKYTGSECVEYYEGALYYRGGEVLKQPKLYLIYYGSNWSTNEEDKKWKGALTNTLRGMSTEYAFDETYQRILHQYWDDQTEPQQISNTVTIGGEWIYEGAGAPQNLTQENVELEINQAISTNKWTREENAIFMVMEPTGSAWTESYAEQIECGEHRQDRWGDVFAIIPDYTDKHFSEGCVQNSTERSETETASHEYSEAVTDPHPFGTPGWTNEQGFEIADICDSGPEMLNETLGIYVTALWGNNEKTCVIHDPPENPPPPPIATTEGTTNLRYNEATVHGSVNPNGPETHYRFEYGRTTSYGSSTLEGDAGYGGSSVAVNGIATYLNYNTRYHYRIVAWSWAGTTYGADKEFTSPYKPPEVRGGAATLLGPTVATLHAEVQQIEYGNPRTTYFEYGPTTSYGLKTSEVKETAFTGWTPVESKLSGLAPRNLYHYRFVAYNNGGTAYSADATFTTTPSPSAITESASQVRPTSAQLSAWVNPGGLSTTYQFEYWPTAKSSEVKDLPSSPVSAGSGTSNEYVAQTLSGLTPNMSYSYRVVATNSVGTTRGETVKFVTTAPLVAEPTPSNPVGITESDSESLSCVSSVMCMATGTASNGEAGNIQPYSEYWTGGEWVRETIPIIPGGKNESVGPVSCSSAIRCIALGQVQSTGEQASMGWNGTSWSTNGMVISGEAKGTVFTGLSCIPQAVTCFAVGSDYPSEYQGEQTAWVAELTEFGVTWVTQKVPRLGVRSRFASISCSAANACTAVGTYEQQGSSEAIGFADRWNGTEWKQQTLPSPAHLVLNSVSCPSTTWCMAVGQRESKSAAEVWNGTEWTATSEPPADAGLEGQGSLSSVGCRSATYCVAAGPLSHADAWNGSEWNVVSTIGEAIEYRALACQEATCTAVGSSYPGGHKTATADGVGPPVAETRQATGVNNGNATLTAMLDAYGNETTYQFEYGPTTAYGSKIPTTPGKLTAGYKYETITASLSGLKGTYHYRIVATSSAGTTDGVDRVISPHNWAVVPAATPVGSAEWSFRDAACASATSCVAVGAQVTTSYGELPVAEAWNGSEWKGMTTPLPSGATKGWLWGVACASSSSCEAIGSYKTSSGGTAPLAMGWNGTSWTDQTVTAPGAAELYAVTCTSSTSCILVGKYQATGGYVPLAESWNGSEWKAQTTPSGTSGEESLHSISCTSSSACTATGTTMKEPLALRWNGSSWTKQTPVNPNEGFAELSAVSCTSSTSCMATGENAKSIFETPFHVLSELWNGTEWTRVSISAEGNLLGLSCASVTSCTAVGGGLIEGWNGTEWTAQTPVMPSGQTNLQLESITCPTLAVCMIAGLANHGYVTSIGLIESFGEPIINTEAASNILTTSATVNASVNPDGEVTTYRVEYGTTTSYGSSVPTPEAKLGSEQAAEKVSQNLTGLATGTLYHYRLVATDSSGVTDGPDQTFTTQP